jgi:hypothetical protein
LILAFAFGASRSNAGEIFKCVSKDGTTLYQNFPCNIDSIGSVAANPPPADSAVNKSATSPGKGTSAPQPAVATEPRVGMSADEVKTLWGEPEEEIWDEPGVGGRISNWRYAGGRNVQFNNKHRVVAVQR